MIHLKSIEFVNIFFVDFSVSRKVITADDSFGIEVYLR